MTEIKQKTMYYEILRLIANFLVLYNHLPGFHFYLQDEFFGFKKALYMAGSVFTKINVPIFFMISGALLLKKNDSIKTTVKRILRFVIVILSANFACYLLCNAYLIRDGQTLIFIKEFFNHLLVGDIVGSYWFLYSYLSFLLILPFLQKMCKNLTGFEFGLLILIHFIFSSVIPIINLLLSPLKIPTINVNVTFFTSNIIFYPIVGYFIDNINLEKLKRRHLNFLIGLFIVSVVLSCCVLYYERLSVGEFTQNYINLFAYVLAIVVFILVKHAAVCRFDKKIKPSGRRIIIILGSLTFGIYLMDPIIKEIFYERYVLFQEKINLPIWIFSSVWCLFSMTIGGSITYFLKKIPLINKLI